MRVAIVGILVLCCAPLATALDRPISGAKLTLRRSSSGKEKLVFVSKDPLFLFPAIGSADDPGTGSPGGAIVELSSIADPGPVGAAVPPGLGKPGWTAKDGSTPSHTYKNPDAAAGSMPLKVIVLKQGKRIKITARGVILPFVGPQGGVGIQISTGSLRNCTFFGPSTVHRDEPGRFDAANAPVPGFPNCLGVLPNTSTTFGTTTTTSSTSTTLVLDPCTGGAGFSTCDGSCAGAFTCEPSVAFVGAVPNVISCLCYPAGVTACTASAYPTCGGECPTGGVCQALHDLQSGARFCGCVDPTNTCQSQGFCSVGVCPPGQACVSAPLPANACACGAP
jgi:hypothetical protein